MQRQSTLIMKSLAAVALLSFVSCSAPGSAPKARAMHAGYSSWQQQEDGFDSSGGYEEDVSQTIELLFGGRSLDSDTTEDVDSHGVFGVTVDSYKRGEPFGYEVSLQRSSETDEKSSSEVSSTLTELSFGFRGYFETPTPVVIYVGGGLTGIFAKSEVISAGSFGSEDAFSPGFYAHAGAFYPFRDQSLRLGVDYRQVLFTDVEFGDGDDAVSGDVDYGQLSVFIGWSF